ncbi:hypothetical protein Btru_075287 [Bulinus truncatus]|nr:hypothetical protein Btru_075287 [Bulinus truncatus]
MTASPGSIEIHPNIITDGQTRDVNITCSFSPSTTHGLSSLFSVLLSHSPTMDEAEFRPLASINVFDKKISAGSLKKSATVSGFINSSGESVLHLNWKNPKSDKSGLYRCSFTGVSALDYPLTLTSTDAVVTTGTDQEDVIKKVTDIEKAIKDMNLKFDTLRSQTTHLQAAHDSLLLRLNRSRDAAFHVSPSFNGSRYYLTKYLDVFEVTWAQSTCELYGGYLAEIDDAEEFNFVRNFLMTQDVTDVVNIGGTDEEAEGHWVYLRDRTPLKVFNWAAGEPNEGRNANCQCFWKGGNWNMADSKCVYRNGESIYVYSYLCEIKYAYKATIQ